MFSLDSIHATFNKLDVLGTTISYNVAIYVLCLIDSSEGKRGEGKKKRLLFCCCALYCNGIGHKDKCWGFVTRYNKFNLVVCSRSSN